MEDQPSHSLCFTGHVGSDDWVILAALERLRDVCGLAFGKHTDEVPPAVMLKILKMRGNAKDFFRQFLFGSAKYPITRVMP
ncbi:hypothetical protein PAAG_11263 [Paracoccidioides lutzii Pb01]|uniref:Uncharacterized protein n=1 Tax=Paracoccidioides lutzii (strain ATCC MYA-826 / Pb01) TaxID=502779 RepID=A0A0A2V6Y1_PARBA|nr:hypothetical protein PAAG_11263 [Paracoccidioides lutzii Pb01]KGQ01875.1 hypothetical protein PAAG_11263 [Paracoccidioides lutzii Pb01]